MLLLLSLLACRYHLQVQTTPKQAEVLIDGMIHTSKRNLRKQNQASDDMTFYFWKLPFHNIDLEIRAPEYRSLVTSVKVQRRRLLFHRVNHYHFILISDHLGAGSWSPEEALEQP